MGRRKLFLADDSIAVQKIVQLTFADEGWAVEIAGNGVEALQKLAAGQFDVVLLDATLPEVSGYEICRRLRQDEKYKKTPVVLLIGVFESFDEKEARRSGADDVLTKPFQSIRDMVQKIGAMFGGRSGEQHEPDEPPQPALNKAPERKALPAEPPFAEMNPPAVTAPLKTEAEANVIVEVKPRPEFDDQLISPAAAPVEAFPGTGTKSADLEPVMSFAFEENFKSPVEPQTRPVSAARSTDDSLLDLGEEETASSAPTISETDDVILDLDDEPSVVAPAAWPSQRVQPAAGVIAAPPLAATTQEARGITVDQLSPELIDAIARRVVEHLSTKVLEDVAWDVVPPLAELLIKRQLENQNAPRL